MSDDTTNGPLGDLMTFEAAARAIHMSRERVRDIAIRHRIAIEWGGTAKRRHLRVKLSELNAAILRERYQPPASAKATRRTPPRAGRSLNPLVRC